ncbi:papain-like cysteine protease family protein [Paraclostridium bifermentans]|nr:papain-like cysteine protease family protein [Paraclostridium bifermentans]
MGPGHFTTEGHYIVLTGVTDDGKIIVNDSDSKERSSKTWDVDVFFKRS